MQAGVFRAGPGPQRDRRLEGVQLPGGGDELQGIKKGLLEMADIIGINKADGDNLVRAKITQGDHQAALKYLRSRRECWPSRVLLLSGLNFGTSGNQQLCLLMSRPF